MSKVAYRIQETPKQDRGARKVVAALFINDRSKIPGALSIVPDAPQGGTRPTKLVLDFDANYYDVLPPYEGGQKGASRPATKPGGNDDSL